VILSVLTGAELGGIAGIFVAVPLLALVTVAVRHFLAWRCRDAEAQRLAAEA
jgi:predicted PurR-regulated permease PerM